MFYCHLIWLDNRTIPFFFITHVYFNTFLKHARYSLTDSINGKKDASVPPDPGPDGFELENTRWITGVTSESDFLSRVNKPVGTKAPRVGLGTMSI